MNHGHLARALSLLLLCACMTAARAQEDLEELFEDSAPAEDSAEDFEALFDEAERALPATGGETTGSGKPFPSETETRSRVRVSGFVQNEFAYTYPGDGHYSKFKNVAKVRIAGELSDRVSFQVGGHLQYDPVFEFETYYPDAVEDDQKVWGYVDETYLDVDAGQWELRLGRQHIIWGEMVGLFFADVISALDLREFILPDFDLIRIPQWAARAEYFGNDFKGELVYIPRMTIDNIGEFGAQFYPFPVTLPPGVQANFLEDKAPTDFGNDFGAGARGSWLRNGWDYSLFYYTSPDKTAAFQRSIGGAVMPEVTFRPVHERIHQFGSTVAKDLGSFVFKAEAVQTLDRQVSVTRLDDFDGLEDSNELRYVAGIDWAGEAGDNINVQFFQTWLQDHAPTMIYDELESGMSVFLTTTRLHPDLKPEILWIQSLDRSEWLVEAKLSWDFATDWRAVLGADVFGGPQRGLLGRFDDSDRVYWEFRHSF